MLVTSRKGFSKMKKGLKKHQGQRAEDSRDGAAPFELITHPRPSFGMEEPLAKVQLEARRIAEEFMMQDQER